MSVESTELVERFKAEAGRLGVIVHEAMAGEQVNDCLLNLARERAVRLVVKSASPLADGSGLRRHLEDAGIEVRETEVGHWLAQLAEGNLAGEVSTLTLEQAARQLSDAIGEEVEAEPATVLRAARRALKKAYSDADMGITEASLGVAETGTLIIIGDEGNERLVTVLPRIHVTLLDCLNVVFTMEDATVRLRLLVETAWQGKTPSYVTYLTGRNTTGDIPGAIMARAQGPEEEHIVLVHTNATA